MDSVLGPNEIHLHDSALAAIPEGLPKGFQQTLTAAHHQDWVRAIRSGGPTADGIESAFRSDIISQLSDLCIRTGQPVRWEVYINGGRTPTGLDALEWILQGVAMGAGEILLTSMDADGTLAGYDLELTRRVAESVPVPIIASGGAGRLEHFAQVLTTGKADAALAASLFHAGALVIPDVKDYLANQGIPVRRL